MPNLGYDPKNPSDLLGRPVAVGDVVAWGTTAGKSAALCIAQIAKIRFTREVKTGTYPTRRKECPQSEAEAYTLSLRALKSTGYVTRVNKLTGEERWGSLREGDNPAEFETKLKSIQHVKNIVKLDLRPEDVV